MIFKIAKTELRNLFYSPIAWFLMIVFMVQCAIVYMGLIDGNAQSQEIGGRGLEYMMDLTSRVYTGKGGLFDTVMKNLYLFIPLLTMGLISREINGGTIKLLYSSPVKVTQIVFGKYLAMMLYSLILVAIVGIFMLAGFWHIVALDFGMLLSGVLGFYLLLCAYSAIGLFMSSLTTYQVVAAVGSFIMIGILSYIGTLWQDIDFVRDLTYFLSLSGRTEKMLNGLVTSKDLIYFVIIIYIFLGLTIFKMKAGRESKSFLVRGARYAAIVVSALLIGYISSRPMFTVYLDTTANQRRTLTPNAQRIIGQMGKEKLEVTTYNNLLENHSYLGFPEMRNNYLSVWEPYTRFKSDISFKYINYYDSIPDMESIKMQYPGKNLAEMGALQAKNLRKDFSMFKTPAEIHKIVDLKPELNRFVMQLKYKGRTTFLRVFDDQQVFPSETEVSAAFKRLMQAKLPKIAFLTGNLERDINTYGERDYSILTNASTFRNSLVNQGFDVENISLEQQDVPAYISTLVIADPKTAFSPAATAKIQAYIDKGGNVLIAAEPGKQALINPLLAQFGLSLMAGTVVQPEAGHAPDLVLNEMTNLTSGFYKPLLKYFNDSVPVTMPGAVGIQYKENGTFKIRPLLQTNAQKSWLKMDKVVADSAAIVFSPEKGDVKAAYATALALTRNISGKEQRIVVTGDADFMSNAELKRWNVRNANFLFSTGLYSWLSYGEFPIDTSRPESLDKRMKVSTAQVAFQKIIFIWVLPGLVLLFASILLIRRKRK